MDLRAHRIGKHTYLELLENYRDPESGESQLRCIVRWRAERSLAQELGRTRWEIQRAEENAVYYQGILDHTVRPRSRKHVNQAPEYATFWQNRLADAQAHHAALMDARNRGVYADEAEIEQAVKAEAEQWDQLLGPSRAAITGSQARDHRLAGLAARIRALVAENDPNAMHAELAEIADAIEQVIEEGGHAA